MDRNRNPRYLRTPVIILLVVFVQLTSHAQSQNVHTEESILGNWRNPDNTRVVNFYAQGDKYFGVIVSSPRDGKVKPGDIIFENLQWTGKVFQGTIKTPRGAAACTVMIVDNNQIAIQAQKGFASRKVYWTRSQ
jgi:hypothetical protein